MAAATAAISSLGAAVDRVLEPDPGRYLVFARLDSGRDEAAAAALRAQGLSAVARPDGGAALRAWHAATEPVNIGGRLAVRLAWAEHATPALPMAIELGPGGFGSGHHATTRMLLELVVDRMAGGERVLDVGCGSGILALAAARLGAGHSIGVDRKPEAVEATARNAAANGLAERVTATVEMPAPSAAFDIVLANIAREGIVALADRLVGHTAAGGWLAVSGISPAQCDLVAGFLRPLQEIERREIGDWAALVLA